MKTKLTSCIVKSEQPEVSYQNRTIDPCFRREKHGRDSPALDPVILSQHPGMCGGGPGVLREKQQPSSETRSPTTAEEKEERAGVGEEKGSGFYLLLSLLSCRHGGSHLRAVAAAEAVASHQHVGRR